MNDHYRFEDHPGKDPAETAPVELDWFPLCANFWRANEQFALNEYVRPRKPTGFSYQANAAGTSGSREPSWPITLGQTVIDGSIVWTCSAAGANGLNALTSPSAVSDPTGLTIASVAASESTKVIADYTGGIVDQTYDAVYTATINGKSRVARQRVPVRKR